MRADFVGKYDAETRRATEGKLHENKHDTGRVVDPCNLVGGQRLTANCSIGKAVQHVEKVANEYWHGKLQYHLPTRPLRQVYRTKKVFQF